MKKILILSLVVSLLPLACPETDFNPDSLGARIADYTINLTEIAKKTREDQELGSHGIFALEKDKDGDKRFPAYVGVMSGLRFAPSIGDPSKIEVDCSQPMASSQIGSDAQKIINLLIKKPSNVVLEGQPGIDVDTRVYAIADRLANCPNDVPKDWKNKQVISIDFAKLNKDIGSQPPQTYIAFVKAILDEFGRDAIFYVNNVEDLLYLGPKIENGAPKKGVEANSLLDLFLNNEDVDVIIEASPEKYRTVFLDNKVAKKISVLRIHDLNISELVEYLTAVKEIEEEREKIKIPEDVIGNIARLTRAFVPGLPEKPNVPKHGLLSTAMTVLARVVEATKARTNAAADTDMADSYFALTTGLGDRLVSTSQAIARLDKSYTMSAEEIDLIAEVAPKYFVDEQSELYLVKRIEEKLGTQFKGIDALLGNVKEALGRLSGESAKDIAEGLVDLQKQLKLAKEKFVESRTTATDISNVGAGLSKLLEGIESSLKTAKEFGEKNDKLGADIVKLETKLLAQLNSLKGNVEGDVENLAVILDKMKDVPVAIKAMYDDIGEIFKTSQLSKEQKEEMQSLANGIIATTATELGNIVKNTALTPEQKEQVSKVAKDIAQGLVASLTEEVKKVKLTEEEMKGVASAAKEIAQGVVTSLTEEVKKVKLTDKEMESVTTAAKEIATGLVASLTDEVKKVKLTDKEMESVTTAAKEIATGLVASLTDEVKKVKLTDKEMESVTTAAKEIAKGLVSSLTDEVKKVKLTDKEMESVTTAAKEIAKGLVTSLTEEVKKVKLTDKEMESVTTAAKEIAKGLVTSLTEEVKKVKLSEEEMESVTTAAKEIAKGLVTSLTEEVKKVKLTEEEMESVTTAAKEIAKGLVTSLTDEVKKVKLSEEEMESVTTAAQDISKSAIESLTEAVKKQGITTAQMTKITDEITKVTTTNLNTLATTIKKMNLTTEQKTIMTDASKALVDQVATYFTDVTLSDEDKRKLGDAREEIVDLLRDIKGSVTNEQVAKLIRETENSLKDLKQVYSELKQTAQSFEEGIKQLNSGSYSKVTCPSENKYDRDNRDYKHKNDEYYSKQYSEMIKKLDDKFFPFILVVYTSYLFRFQTCYLGSAGVVKRDSKLERFETGQKYNADINNSKYDVEIIAIYRNKYSFQVRDSISVDANWK